MARPPLRDTFILGLVGLGAALAAFGGWRYAKASAPVSGPIILVTIDGLRADRLPAYGATGVLTPAFDLLARDGIVFERAYAHSPQSLPAHASLLTGRLPFQNGVRDNVGFTVPKSERLVQEILRDRGYVTAGVVSTAELSRATGLDRGFTVFDDVLPDRTSQMASWPAIRDGAAAEEVAEHWLESTGTPRAFLFLHIADLRTPAAKGTDRATAASDSLVAADEAVGRLIRYLKRHQAYDQSTILLVGDHGEGLDAPGENAQGLWLDEKTLRTPLIVKRPAGEGAGRHVRTPVQHADIAPTILDLAKAPVPNAVHGQSLKPLLDGSSMAVGRMFYAESTYGHYHFSWPHTVSMTDGRYRLVRGLQNGLYDLKADPSGRTAAANPEAGRVLAAALDLLIGSDTLPPASATATNDRDRERLEVLGNVSGRRDGTQAGGDPPSLTAPADAAALVGALRLAVRTAYSGEWRKATDQLRPVLQHHPDLVDGWTLLARIARTAGRHDVAVDAARRIVQHAPADAASALALAEALFDARRLNDARTEASRALDLADGRGHALLGASHELLARIALAERARNEAERSAVNAEASEPGRPVVAFVSCRLAHDAAAYETAVAECEQAIGGIEAANARPIRDLHLLTGDSLLRLDREAEAESAYLEELKVFPLSVAARVGLATVYHRTGRTDEAEQEIAALGQIAAPAEANQATARFWTAVGEPRRTQGGRPELRRDAAAGSRTRPPAAR